MKTIITLTAMDFLKLHKIDVQKSCIYTEILIGTKLLPFPISYGSYTISKDKRIVNLKVSDFDDCIRWRLEPFKKYVNNLTVKKTLFWIQKNLTTYMIDTAEYANTKTELVRLRIAVNMIYKLDCLTESEKITWSNGIKDLYWERKKLLQQWYVTYVLPF